MTGFEAGAALALSIALLQDLPPAAIKSDTPSAGSSRAEHVLLVDLKIVPEPVPEVKPVTPTAEKPARPPEQKSSTVPDGGSARPPSKPAHDSAVAKCYDDLLGFSLGDSDDKTNERIKTQDCH